MTKIILIYFTVSKFLVVNGYPREASRKVDFLDMENPHSTCKFQDFPAGLYHSTAAFTGTKAVVCGGAEYVPYESNGRAKKSCYQLMETETFTELQEYSLKSARYLTASVITPSRDLWVIGGVDDYSGLNSTELISFSGDSEAKNKFKDLQPTLNFQLSSHCVAQLNATTAILTGGFTAGYYVIYTYYLDLVDFKITPGPPMNQGRKSHGCGTFSFSGKIITVVAGGWDGSSHLDTTEYLDLNEADPKWQKGKTTKS